MNDHEPPSPWGPRPDNRPPDDQQPHQPPGRKSRFSIFLIGMIAVLFVLILVVWLIPAGRSIGDNTGGLLYDGLLLAFVGAGLWAHVSSSPGLALRHMATWVIIFGVLALGYSVWSGGGRLGGELDTAKGISDGGSISYRADMSGHYFVRAKVNGADVVFMVDTGATDVALTRKDARAIGLPVDSLSYDMPYSTANGVAYGARVSLSTIELGPIKQYNVNGSVLPKGLDYSLLGMSFLEKLTGYKVSGGVLTLYP